MLILSLLLVFFYFNGIVISSSIHAETNEMLLNNLVAKREGKVSAAVLKPLTLFDKEVDPENNEARPTFSGLPIYLLAKIFHFLDYETGKLFLLISKDCYNTGKISTKNLLEQFSQYFVFEDYRLNHAMACELANYFPKLPVKLTDPAFYDQYELSSLKMLRGSEFEDVLPLQIRYKLKSYIHESLYGSDEPLPLNELQWKIAFYRKFGKFALTNSLNHYLEINLDLIREEFILDQERIAAILYLDEVIELYNGPLTNDRFVEFKEKVNLFSIENEEFPFIDELSVSNFTNFHSVSVPLEDAHGIFKYIVMNQSFSKTFFDSFPDDNETYSILTENPEMERNRFFSKAMVQKYSDLEAFKYVWSRTVQDPLDMDRLRSITGGHTMCFVRLLISTSNPDLVIIDSLTKLIRSTENRFSYYQYAHESVILSSYMLGSVIGFDILFRESPYPINVFWYNTNYQKLFNVFNGWNLNSEKFEIYLKTIIKQDNPLPLLFIAPNVLRKYKEMIHGKFDLNKCYIIDLNFNVFDNQDVPFDRLAVLQTFGVYSFKEIVDALSINGYIDIFTSDQFYDFTPNDNEPISISAFVMTCSL